MKNFKKIIILVLAFIIIVIYVIFKILLDNKYEEIKFPEDEIVTENEEENIEEKSYIVLHITGEVINPGIIKIEEGR